MIPYRADLLDYPEEEHQARLMVNDPHAAAWAWIWSYAQNLNSSRNVSSDDDDDYYGTVTADELVETALTNINGTGEWGPDEYISKGGLLEGMSVDQTFWDKLAILKGIEIPAEKRNNFFSCSC